MGILRFILALSVIGAHAGYIGIPLPDGKPYEVWAMYLIDGRQSVALFYIISGFYMALVLNTKYNHNTLKFYFNRFLRLWPTYFVVLIIACFITPTFNNIVIALKDCDNLTKSYVWLCNLFILGTDTFWYTSIHNCKIMYDPTFLSATANGSTFLINSPVFSISIEMIFYLMAPFILKSLKKTWIYFILGFLYFCYVVLSGNLNIVYQYHLFPSSFIYFGLGALAWHYSQKTGFVLTEKRILTALFGCLALMFVYSLFQMVIILCFTFMVPILFNLTKHSKIDKTIGELSYPLYIAHYPILTYLTNSQIPKNTVGLTCVGITLGLAICLHFFLEKPIDKWRQNWQINNFVFNFCSIVSILLHL
ncbi:MAG: acyltransferase [Sphingobacteriaceae bacterium]|nr:acyltransferase [Sphingobacteriaceae bacterium]